MIETIRAIATGAGALSRRAVGTPVSGGMVAVAAFGIFVIPMLYVVFQWLRERSSHRGPTGSPEGAAADVRADRLAAAE